MGLAKDKLRKEKYQWTITNTIFTTEQLKQATKDKHMLEEIEKNDAVVIAQGTNDLKLDILDGTNIYKNLIKAAEEIYRATGKEVHINQVPPMNIDGRNDLTVKVAVLNAE